MCKNWKVLGSDRQKGLIRTAGSILGKLKGVRVKIWPDLQILLHCPGVRVESKKEQGVFCKTTSADRFSVFFDSGPTGS